MFKNLQTTYLLFGMAMIFAMGCSKNNQDATSTTIATIVEVKYACGAAYDAIGFILKTNSNELLTPIDLGLEFRINNLPVKIRYKKTGETPKPFTAPRYELIEIIQISR